MLICKLATADASLSIFNVFSSMIPDSLSYWKSALSSFAEMSAVAVFKSSLNLSSVAEVSAVADLRSLLTLTISFVLPVAPRRVSSCTLTISHRDCLSNLTAFAIVILLHQTSLEQKSLDHSSGSPEMELEYAQMHQNIDLSTAK